MAIQGYASLSGNFLCKDTMAFQTGIRSMDINRKQQKVTMIGYVEANNVLKKVKSRGKKVEIWPYVPYNLVSHPSTAQAYDKKALSGYVRNVEFVTIS
ncbi:Heavy metal-associated isoprenylated plant protein 26 [Acorus calamus]|uniref:Heavy metal-associated isoprenylated plant protein 26 n=1 Tax=Acorus calamus TaxID=4465 RepID=A0AAV9F137_ACOCL|nr:Heavy metal-associated isoprenylated plant protein 26 [Acorus calamus]